MNKECLYVNQREKSLIAIRHVWHGVHEAGGIKNVPIDKGMIQAVRNSIALRKEDIAKQQELDKNKSMKDNERKRKQNNK